jgi:hypothetical protein
MVPVELFSPAMQTAQCTPGAGDQRPARRHPPQRQPGRHPPQLGVLLAFAVALTSLATRRLRQEASAEQPKSTPGHARAHAGAPARHKRADRLIRLGLYHPRQADPTRANWADTCALGADQHQSPNVSQPRGRDAARSPSMCGVSTASSPCTCGTKLPVLLGRAPGGFTGRVAEEHRSTGAGTWCSSGAEASAAQPLQRRASRRRVAQVSAP